MKFSFPAFLTIASLASTTASPLRGTVSSNDTASDTTRQLIIGGDQVEEGEYPYYVSMFESCGGALISPNVVLFAAHCPNRWGQVNVGSYNTYEAQDETRGRFCEEWIVHPDFLGVGDRGGSDWALCRLDKSVYIDQSKVKLVLNTLENPKPFDDLIVIGTGLTNKNDDNSAPDILRDVSVVSVDCANTSYNESNIDDTMICATGDGKEACYGDSGGPLIKRTVSNDGTSIHTHVGVVSWNEDCDLEGYPGVYMSTSVGLTWIISTVCDQWGLSEEFCDNVEEDDIEEAQCDNKLDIEINTDVQGDYLKMNLRETQTGESVLTRKYLVRYYKNYHSVCLKDNTCYDFTFYDPYGDGMCKGKQNGTIALELNGETEFVPDPCGFDFWLSHTICTGSATNAPTDTPTTDAPSNAPTNAPTDLPTTLPTSAPTDAPESNACVDDGDFYLHKNQPNKNCGWIANKKEKRCKKKNGSSTVESFCPSICNPRCTCKNKKGKMTVKGKNKKLTCKEIEKKDLCDRVTEDEEKLSHLCAKACNTCYSN